MLEPEWVYFRIPPQEMTYLTRILEGCEYLGVVTAIDGKAGVGFVRTTLIRRRRRRTFCSLCPFLSPCFRMKKPAVGKWEKNKL